MPEAIDMVGKQFGRLRVIGFAGYNNSGKRKWKCTCTCTPDKVVEIEGCSLRSGHTTSCGCYNLERRRGKNSVSYKHGGIGELIYEVWYAMRKRCNVPSSQAYRRYGGRGISVCHEWDTDYLAFREWMINAGWKKGLTIDRIDNDGNYEPSNCRVATRKEQANNQSTTLKYSVNGAPLKSLHDIADDYGISSVALYNRLKKDKSLTIEQALGLAPSDHRWWIEYD